MSTCGNCKSECGHGADKAPEPIPYIAHESAMARAERMAKRLWVVIIVLIVLLFGTNAGWLWYESQFEVVNESTDTTKITQENEGGYNNYIGNDGDINNAPPEE